MMLRLRGDKGKFPLLVLRERRRKYARQQDELFPRGFLSLRGHGLKVIPEEFDGGLQRAWMNR